MNEMIESMYGYLESRFDQVNINYTQGKLFISYLNGEHPEELIFTIKQPN